MGIETGHYTLTRLDLKGIETLIEWAAEEDWNPGLHDAEAFMKADPEGFYGFFDEDRMIAGGAIVSYNGDFGFMGLFIVKPEYRGRGIGKELWYKRRNKLLSRLKENSSIGMDGVVDMQPFYEKGGFNIAFRDERYQFTGSKQNANPNIEFIKENDFAELLAYDTAVFGYNRKAFLDYWLNMSDAYKFKLTTENKLSGYAVLRKVRNGYKTGPLFANDISIAEDLFKACLNSVPGESVYLDIPVINKDAVTLTQKYNRKYVFECARMYYGRNPSGKIENTFGITTFELG